MAEADISMSISSIDESLSSAWDDVHGGVLPYDAVKAARMEEVSYMQKRGIWTVVSVSECMGMGKTPVSVRWVDTDKGIDKPDLRSRLVARDFNTGEKGRDDLFAETSCGVDSLGSSGNS